MPGGVDRDFGGRQIGLRRRVGRRLEVRVRERREGGYELAQDNFDVRHARGVRFTGHRAFTTPSRGTSPASLGGFGRDQPERAISVKDGRFRDFRAEIAAVS
jgi:hypothetical protein